MNKIIPLLREQQETLIHWFYSACPVGYLAESTMESAKLFVRLAVSHQIIIHIGGKL